MALGADSGSLRGLVVREGMLQSARRRGARTPRCILAHGVHVHPALRGPRARSMDIRGRSARPRWRVSARLLLPGTPRDACGSADGAPYGMSRDLCLKRMTPSLDESAERQAGGPAPVPDVLVGFRVTNGRRGSTGYALPRRPRRVRPPTARRRLPSDVVAITANPVLRSLAEKPKSGTRARVASLRTVIIAVHAGAGAHSTPRGRPAAGAFRHRTWR
jgi:hypothetical protein